MTTVFEARHTDPAAFLDELGRDRVLDAVQDNILRLAYRTGPATYGMYNPRHMNHDQKMAPWLKARYVEASYLAHGQLVKLSAFCGIGFDPERFKPAANIKREEAAARFEERSKATDAQLAATLERVRKASVGLDVRAGALFVEDGAWQADPDSPIETPPEPVCATCKAPIYFANQTWRHADSKQCDVFEAVECSACGGTGRTEMGHGTRRCERCRFGMPGSIKVLHHMADPEIEGRKV
jgi:hypothetical protein